MRTKTLQIGDAQKNDEGFSLIELLAVLTVLSLISLLAVPLFQDLRSGLLGRSAISSFADALRSARQRALTSNTPVRVMIDIDANVYAVPGTPIEGHLPHAAKLKVRTALNEIVEDHRVGLRFYPDGTSTGATIEVAQGPRIAEITVNWLTGEIKTAEKAP